MRTIACVVFVWFGVLASPTVPAKSHVDSSTARYLDSSGGRDWPGYGRTFGEQHYSPLEEINQANIGQLGLAWSMDLGPESSVTQPIEVDGVLYFATGYSLVHAVDAASGKLLWRYDPKAAEKAGRNLRIGWGTRGIAWWNGKIYTGTQDGRLIAIDSKSGVPVWSVQTYEAPEGVSSSGAPRTFDGKVIIGFGCWRSCRGYVTAYDAETGRQLWRFHTVPGNPAAGFEDKAMERAAKTWAGEWWKLGAGGGVWNAMAYDVETHTVYLGSGDGIPQNRRLRSLDQGDNLFLCTILALDGRTGEYKWHYQVSPGDSWDHEPTQDIELADLAIAGKMRKVLIQASKNGFFYVIDRLTGKLISAEPYAKVNWASRIDLKSGRPVENPGVRYPDGTTVELWPSGWGAHFWMPMAYNSRTQLAYIPVVEMGFRYSERNIDLHDLYVGGTGALLAWNPVTQKTAWKVPYPTIINGGVLATAGGLIFQGTGDGLFRAYSADNGKRLWSFAAQGPLLAPPNSYSVNGKQYVTVLTGLAGPTALLGVMGKSGIDPRSQARRVLTFVLDGKAALPPAQPTNPPAIGDPGFKPDAQSATAGEAVFYQFGCDACHGASLVAAGHAPDLRRSVIPLSREAFAKIVRDGGFVAHGMPAFGELTDEQLSQLRQYIRTEAQELRKKSSNHSRAQK